MTITQIDVFKVAIMWPFLQCHVKTYTHEMKSALHNVGTL